MSKLISHKECKQLVGDMADAATPETWDVWHDAHNKPATLYLSIGALMHKGIRGFVWAWGMQERIVHVSTKEQGKIKGLRAQGLEGMISVQTDLVIALLCYRDLPPYRCRIRA